MYQETQAFALPTEDAEHHMRSILFSVFQSLQEKGYNPVNQIVGYILSEDPAYITNYNKARSLIRQIDRDDLLHAMIKSYLS